MDLLEFLPQTFLFSDLDSSILSEIIAETNPVLCDYTRGSVIYSPNDYRKRVGFIVNGQCEVRHTHSDGTVVSINTLSECESFGILAVFSSKEFPSEVYAKKNSTVLFFSQESIDYLIERYPDVSRRIISFFADRIDFLNRKIITFSGHTVEQRLASYLVSKKQKFGISFDFNRKKAAEAINAARASVYRALDEMTRQGIINIDSKKIYINDLKGLERMSK